MRRNILTATLFTVSLVHMARAEGDVSPGVANNKIVTASWDDAAGVYVAPPVSGYEFEFGEDPLDPFFVEDPGFRSKDGSFPAEAVPFIPSSTLRFSIVSDLLYWDGNGAKNFGPAPAGSLLTLEKGPFSVTVGTGETLPKAGLLIGTSDSSAALHEHIGSTISNSNGDPVPGFYQFSMVLFTDTAGVDPSDPIAMTYELVPEPASLILLSAAVAGCSLRFRRGMGRRQP